MRPQPHQPNPQNEKFCLLCEAAIEQEELGPCPVESEAPKDCVGEYE